MKKDHREKFKQYKKPSYSQQKPKRMNLLGIDIPTKLDWRKRSKTKGKDFTPVKDQIDCNACYAFSAVSAVEAHIALKSQ